MDFGQGAPDEGPFRKSRMTHKSAKVFCRTICGMICGTILFGIVAITIPNKTFAESPGSGDDYSFDWLDPDKKIYVLQNRRYEKSGHLLISALGGVAVGNPYRSTFHVNPRLAYYFSEALGVEVFYSMLSNRENNNWLALRDASGAGGVPVIREIDSQMGGLLHWSPWYAKINVFNQILYFDWYFTAGAGQISYTLQQRANATADPTETVDSTVAAYVGTGHQFHLSQSLIFRLDFMGTFYSAPIQGTTGDSAWFSNYTFGLGVGYRL